MKNKRAKFLSKDYIIAIIIIVIILIVLFFILSPSTMQNISEFFTGTKNATGMNDVRETVHSWWK